MFEMPPPPSRPDTPRGRGASLFRARAIAAAAAVGLVLTGGAHAAGPGTLDLLTDAGVQLDGATAAEKAGLAVAGAGDFNGDGRPDLLIGAPEAGNNGRAASGSAYLVLGQTGPVRLDLLNPGTAGVRFDGAAAGDGAGYSVAAAGDVNGDGRADVLVSARAADNNGRTTSGSVYLILGTANPVNLDLANLGTAGVRIDGAAAGDLTGTSVAGADANGDGRPDLLIGANLADNNARANSGSVYVVFGTASPANVDLANLGTAGERIDGAAANNGAGVSVAGAGDVNGDGSPDLLVGAPGAGNNGRAGSGSAYLILKPILGNVNLASLGAAGVRFDGAAAADAAGSSVAGAGDVNGDGRADVLIGAPFADNNGRDFSGSAYLVRGRAAPVTLDLAGLGTAGARFDGGAAFDFAGTAVAGVGDVNGDGRADLAVGAPGVDGNGRSASGAANLIFGQATPAGLDLASLGAAGVRIDGAAADDGAGTSVAAAGDVTGDGRADMLIGAPSADNNGRFASGSAYLVRFATPSLSYPQAALTVGSPATLTPAVTRTGSPAFTVAPALPAGLGLDPASGVISGTPSAAGTSQHTVQMTDLAGTASATFAITIAAQGAVAGLPVGALCATPAPVNTSTPGKVTLTVQQLAINQRIGQAAIRRLNAIEAWLNAGVVAGDICGGGLGASEFAPSVVTAAGPAQTVGAPTPRSLQIAKPVPKNATFTLSARQMLIDQRIYQAALRRARGLEARLGGALTGGDMRDGQVGGPQLAVGLVIGSAASSPAPAASTTTVAPRTGGSPGEVTLSTRQLAINQKIAQVGVREANALRARLQTGLSGANFADRSLTAADLAPGLVP